ncbi:MAG: gliding motility-associated C-terminal domain-containing protein, partial [Ginsengibacter sp.]
IAPNSYEVKKLLVYNKYGQLLFNKRSVDPGWDGTFKGMPQPVGVYVYYLEMLSLTHKRIVKKGTISLLR